MFVHYLKKKITTKFLNFLKYFDIYFEKQQMYGNKFKMALKKKIFFNTT